MKRGKGTPVIDRGDLTDEAERIKAEMLLSPEMMALDIAMSSIPGIEESKLWDDSSSHIMAELQTKSAAVNSGDLSHVESMLVNQAIALQHIFLRMTVRGIHQAKMEHIDGFMRLALKAQNQSRATLETLASMRTPPVVYARQANINQGNGNQQVNNGTSDPASRAGEIINQPNELLEAQHGERMDTGTAGATIVKNPAMATLD